MHLRGYVDVMPVQAWLKELLAKEREVAGIKEEPKEGPTADGTTAPEATGEASSSEPSGVINHCICS
jgi:hypothetical protein